MVVVINWLQESFKKILLQFQVSVQPSGDTAIIIKLYLKQA